MIRKVCVFALIVTLATIATIAPVSATWSGSDDAKEWEVRRGDALYGNPLSYLPESKDYSSSYVKLDGGLIYLVAHPSKPHTGKLDATNKQRAERVMENAVSLVELAGGSKKDIIRNPVRSNDTSALVNDPNNALIIRAQLAESTHDIYGLYDANGVVSWPKFPSDQEKTPPGRSYVILNVSDTVNMDVTAFVGSSRDATHDYRDEIQTIAFNNLPFNWTALSAADQLYLENNDLCLANGTCYHYSSPTSLGYTPCFTVCDGAGHNGFAQCRYVCLRSCERAFSMMDQNTQIRNAAGLVIGGKLRWRGQLYECTDVVNYNGGGALWCRIKNDADIAIAWQISQAHHANGARLRGFQPTDDVLIDTFLTEPISQYPFLLNFISSRYPVGKYPALDPSFGTLVGGDKIELTGEHSTGRKYYSSEDRRRRVTVSSLEGSNTVRVGSEAYGTAHSGHVCSGTPLVCRLSSNYAVRVAQAMDNAFADLRSVNHNNPIESVTKVKVYVQSEQQDILKPLVAEEIRRLWPNKWTRPVVHVEPHRGVWPYTNTTAGGVPIEGPNSVIVMLRSVKRNVRGSYY